MYAAFQELGRSELVLYTDSLIARGTVRTRQHRVTDILNLADDPFLILRRSRSTSTAVTARRSRRVRQINLDTVLFAVANTPVEPIPELRRPRRRSRRSSRSPVPGHRHRPPAAHRGNLREALTELTGRFCP